MLDEFGGRPNDERGFLHKSKFGKFIGGAIKTVVPGVSTALDVVSTGRALFRGGRSPAARPTVPRTQTARVTQFSLSEKRQGQRAKAFGGGDFGPTIVPTALSFNLAGNGPCPTPLVMAPDGHCVAPGSGHFRLHFPGAAVVPVGDAVMGRYGAALTPGNMRIDRAVCLRGMQLGDDGLCYNKSQISNKQRMWPAGRKPLLSGGDMRAISIAARAGRRLEGATKRLQRLGMMKKPSSRRLAPHQHAKLLPAVSIK